MGVSVFSGETLFMTQDKLVFVGEESQNSKQFSELQVGKMEKSYVMIPVWNSEYALLFSSHQVFSLFSVIIQSVIRQAGVFILEGVNNKMMDFLHFG